jgi:halocin C8-like bacteriocin domain-containing protein
MIMLILGMIIATPTLACPVEKSDSSDIVFNCESCNGAELKNIKESDANIVEKNVEVALKSADIQKLIEGLSEKGYKLDLANAQGLNAIVDGIYSEAIILPFSSIDDSTAFIEAVIVDNEILRNQGIIVYKDSTSFPTSIDVLTIEENTATTYSFDGEELFGEDFKAKIQSAEVLASTNPLVSIQATSSSEYCDVCTYLYDYACRLTYSVIAAVLCTLSGATSIYGAAKCAFAAFIVLEFINNNGCGATAPVACEIMGLC